MASNFSPMYFEQPIVVLDTTESLNSTTGSFVLYGGVSINATYQSSSLTSGAFIVDGGASVKKNLFIGGTTNIKDTTESNASNQGALVVDGGIGVAKNLSVGGDATIAGNLYVNGTTTSVNTTTINVSDNTLLLNSGPVGSRDAGVMIQRFQKDNDLGNGDVVAAVEPVLFADTVQATSTTTSIVFSAGASAVTGFYNDAWIRFGATSANPDSIRQITAYDGDTKTATLSTALPNTPVTDDAFELFNRNFMAQFYDESTDKFTFAYVANITDIQTSLLSAGLADLLCNEITATHGNFFNANITNLSAGSIAISSADLTSATITNLIVGQTTIGSMVVTGASVFDLGLTAGSLMITGSSLLGGNLTVSGASVFNAGLTTGSIMATGNSLLQGSLTVSGASVFNAGLTTGSIMATGNSLLQGSLTVSGASVFNAGLTAGSLMITGSSLLQGDVTVSGASVFNAGLTAGSLMITGSSLLQGSLTVSGASVFNAGLTAGSLMITGSSLLQGSLTVSGGSIFTSMTSNSLMVNTVDMTPSLGDIFKETSFDAANNQSVAANVTGFAFANATVRAFDAIVSVTILTTGNANNKYAYHNLKGVQKGSNWVLNSSLVGDITGIVFSIDNSGQLKYTSTNTANFVSSTIKFRGLTTSV